MEKVKYWDQTGFAGKLTNAWLNIVQNAKSSYPSCFDI